MGTGIKTKPRTEKEKLKARIASFSDVDNARVAQAKRQSANGFKGQELNDHGLPAGRAEIIQKTPENTDGAKFRKQTYADGSKDIKVKKTSTISQDEAKNEKAEPSKGAKVPLSKLEKGSKTYQDGSKSIKTKSKGGMSNFIHGEADKVKNMSDDELRSATTKGMNFYSTKQNKQEEGLINEAINRKWKKQGGYASGTKSIKTKKMS